MGNIFRWDRIWTQQISGTVEIKTVYNVFCNSYASDNLVVSVHYSS